MSLGSTFRGTATGKAQVIDAQLPKAFQNLSPRELRICQLIAKGCTNAEVLKATKLNKYKLKCHLFGIYNKTGMANRLELALWYVGHQTS